MSAPGRQAGKMQPFTNLARLGWRPYAKTFPMNRRSFLTAIFGSVAVTAIGAAVASETARASELPLDTIANSTKHLQNSPSIIADGIAAGRAGVAKSAP